MSLFLNIDHYCFVFAKEIKGHQGNKAESDCEAQSEMKNVTDVSRSQQPRPNTYDLVSVQSY